MGGRASFVPPGAAGYILPRAAPFLAPPHLSDPLGDKGSLLTSSRAGLSTSLRTSSGHGHQRSRGSCSSSFPRY